MADIDSLTVDFIRPVRPLIYFLQIVGIWPSAAIKSSSITSWLYAFYTVGFQLIFTFSYDTFKCISFFYLTDLSEITRAMFICLTEVSLSVKIINFYCRIETIQQCLKIIKNIRIEKSSEAILFTERLAFLTKIISWYLITANMTGIFSYMSPLLVAEPVLPYPGWYPLDWYHSSRNYWIIYAYQVLGMFFQIQTLVIIEVFFIYLMITISAQLDIIGERIERIGYNTAIEYDDSECNAEAESKLIECIKLHSEILRFTSTVETAGSIPYFVQFIFSGIVLCVSVFQIAIMNPGEAIAEFVFYVGFVMTMLTQIFLPCYFGNAIVLKSNTLSRAVYFSDWPDRSPKYRRLVLLYMELLKNPRYLVVGKMFGLTLGSFLSVLNKAYSLFAVLQSFVM